MAAQLDVDDAAAYDKLKTVYLALPAAPRHARGPTPSERVQPAESGIARAAQAPVASSALRRPSPCAGPSSACPWRPVATRWTDAPVLFPRRHRLCRDRSEDWARWA
ncbi:MAG: hypothetical protein WKG07_04310 [Hymenobacter sp.]